MKDTVTNGFDAGPLCLDFANAWNGEASSPSDYADLLLWARALCLLDDGELSDLQRLGKERQDEAASVRHRASRLAAALRSLFSSVARGTDPKAEDLEMVNTELRVALPRLRLGPGEGCCSWQWSAPEDALDRMLWPVVRSAADLLTSPELNRVGQCASPACSWLFVDRSRNHRRKWCDMSTCGNRAKAKRHYRRRRDPKKP